MFLVASLNTSFDIPKQATDIFNVAMLCKYSCKKFTQRIYTLESAQLILEIFQILGASLLDRTQEMQYVFSDRTFML